MNRILLLFVFIGQVTATHMLTIRKFSGDPIVEIALDQEHFFKLVSGIEDIFARAGSQPKSIYISEFINKLREIVMAHGISPLEIIPKQLVELARDNDGAKIIQKPESTSENRYGLTFIKQNWHTFLNMYQIRPTPNWLDCRVRSKMGHIFRVSFLLNIVQPIQDLISKYQFRMIILLR